MEMDSAGFRRSFKLSKVNMEDVSSADRISELEDGLLENIVSRLTMSEAVATSFISRRFQHSWAYSSGTFHFDFGSAALTTMNRTQVFTLLNTERSRYIWRVQQFIMSHNGPTMDAFRIKFDLRSKAAIYIDDWIRFAIRKRVRRLELDLRRVDLKQRESLWPLGTFPITHCYHFPLLESIDKNKKPNLNRLTNLNLNFVNLTRETVEYILSNCLLLEHVRILNSPDLAGVKVVATCPKLKHLEIAHCHNLGFLDIYCAPNQVSLLYSGPTKTRVCLKDVPKLVDVSLQGEYCRVIVQKFDDLHLAFSQIQVLKLLFNTVFKFHFNKFPELNSVTQLELELRTGEMYSLLSCAHAIEACPNLCTLSIKFNWLRKPKPQRQLIKQAKGNSMNNNLLKVVQVSGFRGSTADVELVTYLFSTARFLEKIKVDTIYSDYVIGTDAATFEENLHAKNLAIQLASQLSPAAQLLVC